MEKEGSPEEKLLKMLKVAGIKEYSSRIEKKI